MPVTVAGYFQNNMYLNLSVFPIHKKLASAKNRKKATTFKLAGQFAGLLVQFPWKFLKFVRWGKHQVLFTIHPDVLRKQKRSYKKPKK